MKSSLVPLSAFKITNLLPVLFWRWPICFLTITVIFWGIIDLNICFVSLLCSYRRTLFCCTLLYCASRYCLFFFFLNKLKVLAALCHATHGTIFSKSICSFHVSVSHYGNYCNILSFFTITVFLGIYDHWSLMLLLELSGRVTNHACVKTVNLINVCVLAALLTGSSPSLSSGFLFPDTQQY